MMAPRQQSPASNRYIQDVPPSGMATGANGAPKARGAKGKSAKKVTHTENLAVDFVIFSPSRVLMTGPKETAYDPLTHHMCCYTTRSATLAQRPDLSRLIIFATCCRQLQLSKQLSVISIR